MQPGERIMLGVVGAVGVDPQRRADPGVTEDGLGVAGRGRAGVLMPAGYSLPAPRILPARAVATSGFHRCDDIPTSRSSWLARAKLRFSANMSLAGPSRLDPGKRHVEEKDLSGLGVSSFLADRHRCLQELLRFVRAPGVDRDESQTVQAVCSHRPGP